MISPCVTNSYQTYNLIVIFLGKVMKQLIFEREALTTQWKEAIKMMHQRDNDVVHIQEQIMVTLELIQKEEEKLDEENNFLNNEKRNNRELELDLQKINAVHSKMRRELNDLSQHMIFLNSEVKYFFHFLLRLTLLMFFILTKLIL